MRSIEGGRSQLQFDKNDKIELSPIEIERAGAKIKVTLLSIGPEEGLTVQQAADLFDVTVSTIHKHLQKYAISYGTLSQDMLKLLKDNEIVSSRAPRVIFIPRQGLRDLMWVIGTPEAKVSYDLVFKDADAYQLAKARITELESAQAIAKDRIAYLEALNIESNKVNDGLRKFVEIIEAKLDAVIHLLMKRAKRSKGTWSGVEFKDLGTDSLGKCHFLAILVPVSSTDTPSPSNAIYKNSHCAKTIFGSSKSLRIRLSNSGHTRPHLLAKADELVDVSHSVVSEIMNVDPPLFIKDGKPLGFFEEHGAVQ